MYRKNQARLFEEIKEGDFVVDIGGGAQPLKRANKVIDFMSYEDRSCAGNIGDMPERFGKADWITRDLCQREPLPFGDKEVDFVFCSHVLEDVRDPIWLCSEIVRIGKRGYIEVPSRAIESCRGIESHLYAGYLHHRWLIEYNANELIFIQKSFLINIDRLYMNVLAAEPIVGFFWYDSFDYREKILADREAIVEDYKRFRGKLMVKMSSGQRILNEFLYYAPILLILGRRWKEWKKA